MRNYVLWVFIVAMVSACSFNPISILRGTDMDKLELGMAKREVTAILGKGYTIAEKRVENGQQIEVLSYRDFYREDELYMFVFIDDKLEEWYRKLTPRYAPAMEPVQQ